MSQVNTNFKAAEVGGRIKSSLSKLDKLLTQSKNDKLSAIRAKLRDRLKEYQTKGGIRVAFIGQYNAGKSTMISALTGRRDIRIDSDIATDTTSIYDWNGIQIIDTPGLFTDRKDHDEITYEAIDKADLLVFSLTYMLFDSVTAKNFKHLAYEKGYRWKMMIVVNKMSDEAGEEEQKIANYRQSLATAIAPYDLNEFSLSFVDAKDYCEGIDEEDDFLVEISRFPTFTDALNNFVERRSSLTKFDTPVRIVLRQLDDAQNIVMRDSIKDTAFFELLSRINRSIQQERDRLRTKVKSITLNLSAAVVNEGSALADLIGAVSSEDFESHAKQTENKVQSLFEEAADKVQREVEFTSFSTIIAVEELLQGDLFKAFEARLSVNQNISANDVNYDIDPARLYRQVNILKNIAKEVRVKINNPKIKSASSKSKGDNLQNILDGVFNSIDGVLSFLNGTLGVISGVVELLAMDDRKDVMYQVSQVGKRTDALESIITGVGSMGSAVFNGVESYIKKEQEKKQKLLDARLNLTSRFVSMSEDLEGQVDEQLREFESQFFGTIEQQILEARQREEVEIKSSNHYFSELVDLRNEFQMILSDISKSANS
jgi:GTP-binding protein EngB required for normal cell division